MVILLSGASHTGKTLLAQRLIKKLHFPCLSIDLLKMGLIRSKQIDLTPSDDKKLIDYLYPIIKEIIKTAIENKQNLIIEGAYIPFCWQQDFNSSYVKNIDFLCLIFSKSYIKKQHKKIKKYANIIEKRLTPSFDKKLTLKENKENLKYCKKYNLPYILVKKHYKKTQKKAIQRILHNAK